MKTQQIDGETLYLHHTDGLWTLIIEPANRNNGTQSYDGWFPRYYSKASSAKAAVTKKFGREWQWKNA
ncbi:hypothetical protein DYL72_15835 [Vibrio anguillarum]|uniref:WGR domain-containing protein n=1 Tax=Vibrio anguillarum TaxID=55601 RepID=A0A7U6J3Q5_VIBAN|nr:hypothetical protein DYL72_15835 [Vibrio anguillarum]